MQSILEKDIQFIKGIGPKKAEAIKAELGLETIEDILYFCPRRYLDRSEFKPIMDTFVNESVTIGGNITLVNVAGRKKKFLEVTIDDGTDTITGIFFHSISYFQKIFQTGDYVLFSGIIEFYRQKQIIHPDFDFIDQDSRVKSINTARVIPLYKSTEKLKKLGLDSRGFRKIIRFIIDSSIDFVNDPIEGELLISLNLMQLKDAVFSIHFPESLEQAEEARRRLAFNELFFLQFYLSLSRKYSRENPAIDKKPVNEYFYNEFLNHLPFELTNDQIKSIKEIESDLKNIVPMNRLLQGDVGSGKTVAAIAASLLAYGRSDQIAYMAPTEVLAIQHYETFKKFIPDQVKLDLLTGSLSSAEKKIIYSDIKEGKTDIIIGTHAVIQESVEFKNLGLIIIDEQHKFGVNQRASLRNKGKSTDLLIMTATPIPRSLSLTLYGDLDVSYIRMKPLNRIPVKTMSFPESGIKGVYNSIEKYVSQGRQVFVVLPIIQESEKIDLKSAIEEYEKLKTTVFLHRKVDLLHGKMTSDEKDEKMSRFRKGDTDILVSTTVIEVGIDVPNANVIVIEHAERFGLSQLHQLRGRVGRGEHQSFCVLVYPDNISEDAMNRINTIVAIDDGFKIAEEDLKFRGAGSIIGSRQHGRYSGFEFADLAADIDLIFEAKKQAEKSVSGIPDILEVFNDLQKHMRIPSNLSPLLNGIRIKKVLSILS